MDKIRFKEACDKVVYGTQSGNVLDMQGIGNQRVPMQGIGTQSVPIQGIGTLKEKTLHAVLKLYFEPDITCHEKKIGSFVADVVTDNGIIEIQTRAFNNLRRKLTEFLGTSKVTLVYPLPKTKWLIWIDEQTGEITKKRKSPKQGSLYDAVDELYKIRLLLNHPNIQIHIVFINMEEYRYLNGWSHDKKRGSTRYNRIPVELADEIVIKSAADYRKFIPDGLQLQFTTKDFKAAAGIHLHKAQTLLNILFYVGAVKRVGKQGNMHIYERGLNV